MRALGLLLDTRSGQLLTLSARTLVGRSDACLVAINDPRVSAEHAAIAWSGDRWELRDLGSLNGTVVDGRRLAAGDRTPITRDARLVFGGVGEWLLVDAQQAGPCARNDATAEVVHSTTAILPLPSIHNPEATVFRGTDGQWLVELGMALRTISDLDSLELGGACWRLFLPRTLGPPPDTLKADGSPLELRTSSLWFVPSLDEEHVDVRIRTDDGNEWLLPPRSSHYVLLTLARARIDDAGRNVPLPEQGWIYSSDLADMLGYTAERLNIEIFRSRALFAKLGFTDPARLIERRPATRQTRIGIEGLHVRRR